MKKLFLISCLFMTTLFGCKNNVKLTGVVTFQSRFGTKPDIGAKVFYINEENGWSFEKKMDMISADEKWLMKNCKSLVVDGSGRYSADIESGTYDIVIFSNNKHWLDIDTMRFDSKSFFTTSITSNGEIITSEHPSSSSKELNCNFE